MTETIAWVSARRFAAAVGYTDQDIRRHIEKYWTEGREYRRTSIGAIEIDLGAFNAWVESGIARAARAVKPAIKLPTQLYRHFDGEGRLLYVGISLSAMHRLAQHKSTAGWYATVRTVTLESFESRESALAAETKAIRTEHPLHNKAKVVKTKGPTK